MKKSCVNCAFCILCKDYRTPKPISSIIIPSQISEPSKHIKYTERNLTDAESNALASGDTSCIYAEQESAKQWENEFKRRFDIVLNNPRMPRIEYYSMAPEELSDLLRMPQRPVAPESIYLRCWHEQWNSQNNTNLIKSRQSYKCRFYYPLKEKGGKTFEGCYRQQQDKKAHRSIQVAIWTLVATVIGLIISVILKN